MIKRKIDEFTIKDMELRRKILDNLSVFPEYEVILEETFNSDRTFIKETKIIITQDITNTGY